MVNVYLDDDHQLTTGTVADNDVTQQTNLSAQVEERYVVMHGIIADVVANLIVQVVHQPALLDRQYLIESTRDMETYGRYVLQTLALVLRKCGDLFFCQITLVGTSEVQLVTILLCLYRTEDRTELWELYLTDAV